jgi:hypothetical protein
MGMWRHSHVSRRHVSAAPEKYLQNGLFFPPGTSSKPVPSAPETIAWLSFSLADYGPLSLTPEVALALS